MDTTCLIIDDEKLARELLHEYLEGFAQIKIIGECAKGTEAVEKINKLKPDLIFLDVQMPGMNGFDVLEEIDHEPYIIFTTAYNQYAIKAFEKNAVGNVFNIGNVEEISIMELAKKVKKMTASASEIVTVPYEKAYAPGFEDMERRVPDISKIKKLTGWNPAKNIDEILRDVIAFEKNAN